MFCGRTVVAVVHSPSCICQRGAASWPNDAALHSRRREAPERSSGDGDSRGGREGSAERALPLVRPVGERDSQLREHGPSFLGVFGRQSAADHERSE